MVFVYAAVIKNKRTQIIVLSSSCSFIKYGYHNIVHPQISYYHVLQHSHQNYNNKTNNENKNCINNTNALSEMIDDNQV